MKVVTLHADGKSRMAVTQTYNLLDNQLILFLRSWGSADYNQKFADEVSHYLSSAQADLDVTTPFDYQENLSSLANKTRVAILLTHDLFSKNENKNEFSVGFEATVIFKLKTEMAWSSVGRFAIDKIINNNVINLLNNGSDLDTEILLPVQLIGVEREIDISSGSVLINDNTQIMISSAYQSKININTGSTPKETKIDAVLNEGSYWHSIITTN